MQVYQTRDDSITEKFRKALESTSHAMIPTFVEPEQPACPASMLALTSLLDGQVCHGILSLILDCNDIINCNYDAAMQHFTAF
ncbi:hypothetical protein FVD38_24895 [Massilia arenae]|uniref:Uncharacterized protein n=1 Tax=Massilia arenae TaxID=2603288 RepID=A0A5C7FZC5_9BURK|nr:hypothetical protein FVD38_24895 [Massilia arenae]